MPQARISAQRDTVPEILRSFAINEQINQFLVEHLEPAAWAAKVPGSRTRSIAAIFAHIHNIRRKWIRLSAMHLEMPAAVDRACTQAQACKALAESGKRCLEMIEQALTSSPQEMKFLRDGWARPWPAGPMMVAYMITHEAHHRGQVCMLAHQLGFPLSGAITAAMWNWERMWKQ
jgi:uncharacterized damage-inducible protein DinB